MAWDFMVGCVHWMQFAVANKKASTSPRLSLNTKKLTKNGDGYTWMGSACRPNPKWEAAANKLEIQKAKTRRGQLRPPAQGVVKQIQRQPLQLRLLAEARGQGPGLVSACQRKGGEDFFFSAPRAPERAAEAGAQAAAVDAEPEGEPSQFQLWQGPAERREEFPELRLVASKRTCPVGGGLGLGGLPESEPAAPETEPEALRFLEPFEFSVLACGRRRRGRGRCPKSSA